MCLFRGHNSKALFTWTQTWGGNADQSNKVFLFSYIISLKCQSRSFLFALKRPNHNTETRKGLQGLWTSTRPWLIRFMLGQDRWLKPVNLATSSVAVLENIPQSWKLSSSSSPHPSSWRKHSLSLSTLVIFPGEKKSVWDANCWPNRAMMHSFHPWGLSLFKVLVHV